MAHTHAHTRTHTHTLPESLHEQDNHRWDQSALSVLFHRRNDLNRAAAAPPLFLETSPIYWVSRSLLPDSVDKAFENPRTHYQGIYFYARRSHYPKPFKSLVRRTGGT